MPIEQVPDPVEKFSPLRGSESERQAAVDVDPHELNVTTDQLRIFIGTTHVAPSAYHSVVDQTERLGLHGSAVRGCWPGDHAHQSDTGHLYLCISNNGGAAGDWSIARHNVDSALSGSSTNPVQNSAINTALAGKSNTGHTHAYNELTGIPSSFVPAGHTHTLSEVTDAGSAAGYDVPSSGDASTSQVVKGDDTRLSNARTPTSHTHPNTEVTGLGTASTHNVPSSGDAASGEVVKGSDTRLTNARTPTSHTHPNTEVTGLGTASTHNVPASGDAAAGEVVKGGDSRLTNARTPTSHTHPNTEVTGLGTASTHNVPVSGNAAAGEVVKGNDTRLADTRDPNSHAHTLDDILDSGSAAELDVPSSGDASSTQVVKGNDSRLTNARTPTSHTHPNTDITGLGTASTHNVPSSGDAASGEVVKGNDSRLTNARTPTSHTHSWGDITGKPSLQAELPEGTVIMWVSSIGGVSAPAFDSSEWIRCEGGTISGGIWNTKSAPDFRDEFIRGNATSLLSGGANSHTHTISTVQKDTEADAGNCLVVESVDSGTTLAASNIPKYKTAIFLLKYA